MSSHFLLGLLQTAIGSALGFVFGVGAFHYQQKWQSEKKEKDAWRASLDALNRLSAAGGANIEALAVVKMQFILTLRPEVERMKAATEAIYNLPPKDRNSKVKLLKELSESLVHFYVGVPKVSTMSSPNVGEYSLLSKDMPALTLFVHRAMSTMEEINELIKSRNTLISEHAREGGTGEGMTSERLIFFSIMLSSQGEAICTQVDDALDFWRLVLDQLDAYMTVKAKGEHNIKIKIVPEAIKMMPQKELFPWMREQIETFKD